MEGDDEVLNGSIELDVTDGENLVVVVSDGHQAVRVKLGKVRAAAFLTMCADAAAKLFEIEESDA